MAFVFTDDNTEQEIQSGKPVVIDFWATWCGPCKKLAPVIDELATKYEGQVMIGKYNLDDDNDIAANYQISGLPTLLFFKNGEVVKRLVGARPASEIESNIKDLLQL